MAGKPTKRRDEIARLTWELESSRQALSSAAEEMRQGADFRKRAKNSFEKNPLPWILAGTVGGIFVFLVVRRLKQKPKPAAVSSALENQTSFQRGKLSVDDLKAKAPISKGLAPSAAAMLGRTLLSWAKQGAGQAAFALLRESLLSGPALSKIVKSILASRKDS